MTGLDIGRTRKYDELWHDFIVMFDSQDTSSSNRYYINYTFYVKKL